MEKRVKILILSPEVPFPPDKGGRIRAHNIFKRLAKIYDVHLVVITDGTLNPAVWRALGELYSSVTTINFPRTLIRKAISLIKSLLLLEPYVLHRDSPPKLKSILERIIHEKQPDLIFAEFHYLCKVLPLNPIPRIVDLQNLDHLLYLRFAKGKFGLKKFHGLVQAPLNLRLERALPRIFDYCLTVSKEEENLLKRISAANNVITVANGIETKHFKYFRHSPKTNSEHFRSKSKVDLIFYGAMDYYPNADGASFLVEEILPLAWRVRPEITTNIVGKGNNKGFLRLAKDPRVRILGYVDDVRPYIFDSRIVVIPLRMGAGTRLKAIEGAMMRKPIIGTSIGLEGLSLENEKHALIVDSAPEFASAIIRCLNSPEFCEAIASRGAGFVEKHFDWNRTTQPLIKLIGNLTRDDAG